MNRLPLVITLMLCLALAAPAAIASPDPAPAPPEEEQGELTDCITIDPWTMPPTIDIRECYS